LGCTSYELSFGHLIKTNRWSWEAIEFAQEKNIIIGEGGAIYNPTGEVIREDLVAVISMLAQETRFGITSRPKYFSDAASSLAREVINTYGSYIESGENFKPKKVVKREELAVVLSKVFKLDQTVELTGETINKVQAINNNEGISTLAMEKPVGIMLQLGIFEGDGTGRINPRGIVTREQLAIMIQRIYALNENL